MKFICVLIVITILIEDKANACIRRRRTPPRNCRLSPWTSWSKCSHQCGGVQSRTRKKIQHECCGGKCGPLTQIRKCNIYVCQNEGTPFYGRCLCRRGYTGKCCQTFDICSKKPCQHICVSLGHTFQCKCYSCYTKLGTKCELRKCKIGGKCYEYNTVNPRNQCQYCRKGRETAWTNKYYSGCNDGNLCTKHDRCIYGVCKGTPFSCKPCELCNGHGCTMKYGYHFLYGRCIYRDVHH